MLAKLREKLKFDNESAVRQAREKQSLFSPKNSSGYGTVASNTTTATTTDVKADESKSPTYQKK